MKRLMSTILLAALVSATGAAAAGAQAPAADPFVYEPPTGWKPERIPFPLGFAPSLSYKGFEQLHFAPGMFDPKSETYFTYLFFWWVEGEPRITEEALARDLADYYKGLCAAVGGPKKLEIDLTKVSAKVEPAAVEGSVPYPARRFAGRINAFDPFNTGQALALEVEITAWRCDREDRTCVFFCVSPRPRDAAEWAPMRAALSSFRCRR